MIKILLQNFRCIARHGVFAEEQTTGAEFEVNLEVSFEETGLIEKLDQSISYSHLQEIVKAVMLQPNDLLETVCQQITNEIKAGYPFVSEINITLSKLAPPIANFQGRVGVNYVKKF
ncbi:MAG: dihydroneopterin aldolase [Chitinophagaceae bacterium]